MRGTAIQLWLPATPTGATVPVGKPRVRPESHQGAPLETARSSLGHVLLVDDELDVLVTTGAFLERAGLRVSRARDGGEALALLAGSERFDALVTDYAMPGLNGADLVSEARAIRPGLAALVITGFAEVKGAEPRPGDVQVLHKPFQREELIGALRRAMAAGENGAVDEERAAVPR